MFFGHPYWLKQLLLNLFTNSIEYNEEGGSVIGNVYIEKSNLIIEVKDTGIGISEEDQERVFERFYKVDKSRSKNPNSTGLGLSIVKHIVELYNGRIEVSSALWVRVLLQLK
ncbi:ATP-binding protein [endosymbiont 'TC1' of Trimyema compressum]|uniref:sensor histidine kinase n=1 Tax=endosymbiont 'TC1' of Trimyema compressum TaxID=243899 RepID=UPI000B4C2BDF